MNDEDGFHSTNTHSHFTLHVPPFGFRNDETGRILSIIMQDMLIKDYHEIRIPLRRGSSTTISSVSLASSPGHDYCFWSDVNSVGNVVCIVDTVQIQVLLNERAMSEYKI